MNAGMPVLGGMHANDTIVEQLTSNARAAVDKLVAMGVAKRGKIGIVGHSYGGFMAATLVAHSDLFATGVALSGAYNLTMSPFGFQHEYRSLWEAPAVYTQFSAFLHADRITVPLATRAWCSRQ